MHFFKVNKWGALSTAAFIIFLLIFRLILPYGDEPDFGVKAYAVKHGESHSAMGLFPNSVVSAVNVSSACKVASTPFSFTASIHDSGCSESIYQILLRLLITCITFLPIFLIIIFKTSFLHIFYAAGCSRQKIMAGARVDGLIVALPFSGYVFYAGLLSNEQLTLMLSTLSFVFLDKKVIIAALVALALVVDFGNTVVVTFFFLSYFAIKHIYIRVGKFGVYVFFMASITVVLILGISILEYMPKGIGQFGEKVSAMHWVLTEGSQADRVDKYPLIFRPLLTFFSFIFYTPSHIKAPLAYVFFAIVYCYAIFANKVSENFNFVYEEARIQVVTFLLMILVFTLTFPTYANGKYYIFALPILSFTLISRFGVNVSVLISCLTSILVSLNVAIYRLV